MRNRVTYNLNFIMPISLEITNEYCDTEYNDSIINQYRYHLILPVWEYPEIYFTIVAKIHIKHSETVLFFEI